MNRISVKKREPHPPSPESGEVVFALSEDELASVTAARGYNGMIMDDTAGKASITGAGGGGYNGTVMDSTSGKQGIRITGTY